MLAVFAAGLALIASNGTARSFHMGFTPFPYDISVEAVDFCFRSIGTDADMIMIHFDDGLPWQEALDGQPFPVKTKSEWADAQNKKSARNVVLLSMTPVNLERTALAIDRSAKPKWDWSKLGFDDARVHDAYLAYVERGIATFQPKYLNIAIEANLLYDKAPALWPGYLKLQRRLYRELKAKHPALTVFASMVPLGIVDESAEPKNLGARRQVMREVEASSDITAFSFYPYMSKYMAELIPETLWSQTFGWAKKRIAISESGYPAAEFRIHNDEWVFRGTTEKQDAFVSRLLQEADKRKFMFVVNFVLRDYDELWKKIGGGDMANVWRTTGLYDAAGNARPAMRTWRSWLAKPYAP